MVANDFGIRCNVIVKMKGGDGNAGEVVLIKRDHIYNIFDYEGGIMVIIKSPFTMLYNDAQRISINMKKGCIDRVEWNEQISQSALNVKTGFPADFGDLASVELVY